MKKILPVVLFIIVSAVFFWQFLLKGFLPIPSDTIVGLYYPFREIYQKTNPNGVVYKNFLITDPVRQQYPWKQLSLTEFLQGNLPLWNPYNFAGYPLLANFQSSVLYPLNFLFLFLSFPLAWSFLIFLQPFLGALFLYLYLDNLRLRKEASFLAAFAFAFSGFLVSWLEWGTIGNTALWTPLILLSVDKFFQKNKNNALKSKVFWPALLVFSLTASFLAGHLQTFFYIFILLLIYFAARWIQNKKNFRILLTFVLSLLLFIILSAIQWVPTLQFILLSARNVDLPGYKNAGWFIPWQNLVQFVAPDFFGNPTTLNYFGIWNYAEFLGYVGILPLILAFFAMFFRRDKKTLFFGTVFFISLFFVLPTFLAKIPFSLNFPFISTAQPTRLLFLVDFSLVILAGLGFDYFINAKNKKTILYILGLFFIIFSGLWLFVLYLHGQLLSAADLHVARQNLIFPSVIFAGVSLLLVLAIFLNRKFGKFSSLFIISCLLIFITVFDLLRFGWKFEPFTNKGYLFPSQSVLTFLQSKNSGQPFRVMSVDSRILPPNFSIMYKIQTLDGYDPLYLQRYGELMAAVGRNNPDISTPFGFNRIITPQNYSSRIISFMNVQYVLSMDKINDPNLTEVFSDGVVRVYENKNAFPRAFFVTNTIYANSKQKAINEMFDLNFLLNNRAVVEDSLPQSSWDRGQLQFVSYSENKVVFKTTTKDKAFMVFTDTYYPTWHATIDGKETKIYRTDFNFRGIIVPKGEHIIEFYDKIF